MDTCVARSASDILARRTHSHTDTPCVAVYPSPRWYVRQLRPYHRAESDGFQSSFEVDSILTVFSEKHKNGPGARWTAMHSAPKPQHVCDGVL